jgi:hypothetical protein
VVQAAKLREQDRKWYPQWLRRCAEFVQVGAEGQIPIVRETVIEFLILWKNRGQKAWQRLQAVRAIELYRDVVLKTDQPSLTDVREKLAELASREQQQAALSNEQPLPEHELVGVIDPHEPPLIQQLRRTLRIRHLAGKTEKAYVHWVERFMKHVGQEDLTRVGAHEVTEFLGHLAVEQNVAASTQNQAFSALLFVFQQVMEKNLEFVNAVRAKKPMRLPVVMSREEVARVLAELGGRDLLIARGQVPVTTGRAGPGRWCECQYSKVSEVPVIAGRFEGG